MSCSTLRDGDQDSHTGAPNLVKLVTEDLPGVTGGKLAVETDAKEAVAAMMAHIMSKREALGI